MAPAPGIGKLFSTRFKAASGLSVFEFAQHLAETRIAADGIEIVVLTQIPEVAITELDGFSQGSKGRIDFFQKGITASEIVMGQGILRTQIDESAIQFQAVRKSSFERQVVAMHAKHVDEIAIAIQDALEKIEFKIKLADLVGFARRRAGG